MENAPVINTQATRVLPQEEERYNKWVEEGYYPIYLRNPCVTGIDRYRIVNESPDYNKTLSIQHFKDMDSWNNYQKSPERAAITKDYATWHREVIWSGIFQLVKSFRSSSSVTEGKQTTLVDDAPIVHLAAFNLNRENAEKYSMWFNEWGQKIYIPILMKLPGLRAINYYRWTGKSREREIRDPDYPRYVSIIYFESLNAYENYAESPELIVLHEALKTPFPGGLDYKWNVQYQLTRSWRK